MTLQQIKYVITIADTGSMNRSAEQLFISQPSLTSAVKELEKELGIMIFRRTSKGVIPTNEGSDFLIRARQLYQQYELLTDRYNASGAFKRKFGVSTQHYSFAV
ncbi:MAG: LysR family transcriptional regulator, partial [Huintestinicola sp.]